ncbi:MAG: hypothetical protein K2Q22_06385 [Cytophagales bacterium]|nr:hypothetical protein [Cytophagales bacterium]
MIFIALEQINNMLFGDGSKAYIGVPRVLTYIDNSFSKIVNSNEAQYFLNNVESSKINNSFGLADFENKEYGFIFYKLYRNPYMHGFKPRGVFLSNDLDTMMRFETDAFAVNPLKLRIAFLNFIENRLLPEMENNQLNVNAYLNMILNIKI